MDTKKNKIQYALERYGCYLLTLSTVILLIVCKINYINNPNFTTALEGVLGMCSLIVGFLGAIIPVVLTMKTDSKVVKYLLAMDTDKLLFKYMKHTLIVGIVTVILCIVLFFVEEFPVYIQNYSFYVWCGMTMLCVCSTYRSLKYMMEIVFMDDSEINFNLYDKDELETTEAELELQKKCKI